MDKNQATGLVVISALLLVYFWFFAPEPPKEQATSNNTTTTEQASPQGGETAAEGQQMPAEVMDSIKHEKLQGKYGPLAAYGDKQEQFIEVNTPTMRVVLSNRGAQVDMVELKKYKRYDNAPLILYTRERSEFKQVISAYQGPIDLSELYFNTEATDVAVEEGDSTTIRFSMNWANGGKLVKEYKFYGEGYQVGYDIQTTNFDALAPKPHINFHWTSELPRLEREMDGNQGSRVRTYINYYTTNDEFDDLSAGAGDLETDKLENPAQWIAFKQKFFTSAILANNNGLQNGSISLSTPNEGDTSYVKKASMNFLVQTDKLDEGNSDFRFFFGPNNYQVLKKVAPAFSENVDLGWGMFGWINRFLIIPIFNFLENYITNYGVIIIILVLIVKIILSPLSYKSYISMAKTKTLKPELDALKEKHGDDMQAMQKEQMKLYQQVGVNPISGCIPILLQMPILLAMFNFFPNSVELRQKSFLWADDLSTYDSVLSLPFTIPFYGDHVSMFTLLMTGSTILYTWSNNQVNTMQGPMKYMSYAMPVMFMFVLNSFPAGLSFYYFVSNLVTFGQQTIIRRFVDEDKIRQKLEENKKNSGNKKKSKFQQRLEDAMKSAEAAQAAKEKDKGKRKK